MEKDLNQATSKHKQPCLYPALLGSGICITGSNFILPKFSSWGCLREAVGMFLKMLPNLPRLQERRSTENGAHYGLIRIFVLIRDGLYDAQKADGSYDFLGNYLASRTGSSK